MFRFLLRNTDSAGLVTYALDMSILIQILCDSYSEKFGRWHTGQDVAMELAVCLDWISFICHGEFGTFDWMKFEVFLQQVCILRAFYCIISKEADRWMEVGGKVVNMIESWTQHLYLGDPGLYSDKLWLIAFHHDRLLSVSKPVLYPYVDFNFYSLVMEFLYE